MGGHHLSPRQRDMAEARQRIKYKYARPYMDEEPATTPGLREEINRIIAEEMNEIERELLENDLRREMVRIREYHKDLELPQE